LGGLWLASSAAGVADDRGGGTSAQGGRSFGPINPGKGHQKPNRERSVPRGFGIGTPPQN